MRVPRDVLEGLEAVRQYTRAGVLDIPTLRYVAMEREKPALVVWIDGHPHGPLTHRTPYATTAGAPRPSPGALWQPERLRVRRAGSG